MPFVNSQELALLPPWIQELFGDLEKRSKAISEERYIPYGYREVPDLQNPRGYRVEPIHGHPGRLAPINEQLQSAHRLAQEGVGQHIPFLENAQAEVSRALSPFPENAEYYMNPYQQHVVNRIAEEGNRNFEEHVLPALEAKFVRLGQHGSKGHTDLAHRAARDIQKEILARQQQALQQGYQQSSQLFNADQMRKLAGAEQLVNLGAQHKAGTMSDIKAQEEAGRYLQQQEQAKRDIMAHEYQQQYAEPSRKLSERLAVAHGMPYERAFTNVQQTPGTPQMNLPGQLAQLAAGIYGARQFGAGR